jgi:transposase
MNSHKNAPLTPKGREAMVRFVIDGGLSKAAAARQFNTTPKTVAKWVGRFRAEGVDGLRDRSSRPLSLPSQTVPATCAVVEALRRQRYTGKQKAFAFRDTCRDLGIKHIRTKPYTPKTNGKAERFIQTALREWAYAQAYPTSDRRAEELPIWLHRYNWHRPHGGIKSKTPISRLGLTEDNLLRLHI